MRSLLMPILNIFGLIFEWHDDKFELVHKNRGITLEEVASVFFDDNAITQDDFGDYSEQRTIIIGISNKARLLTVVYTERNGVTRIITAFFPSKHQQKEYANVRY